jgi:hypothetical protein
MNRSASIWPSLTLLVMWDMAAAITIVTAMFLWLAWH